MTLVLIHATSNSTRERRPFPGLSAESEKREMQRLRSMLNRWKWHAYAIRDDDGHVIGIIDLRTVVGVECDTVQAVPAEVITERCGKSLAANDSP